MDADPLSVILVKSDSKGDRLLFRYPFAANERAENLQKHLRRKNPYALTASCFEESFTGGGDVGQHSYLDDAGLTGFSDQVLSNLFAVKQELAEAKFELKANDVRFVGHPTSLFPCSKTNKNNNRSSVLINVVFALKASASHSIVKCYYELSKRLGVALRHEEKRCGYVTAEMKTAIVVHEEGVSEEGKSPYEEILEKSSLARDLRRVYDDVKSTGLVHLRVNRWIELSFCLPQKVHHLNNRGLVVDPETIDRCLQSIRPYHGLLLLHDASHLLDSLVPDASPALIRLIKIYTPLKSLQTLSADADLTLAQVFNLAGHLVYWGKATIIYPLCESNVYVTAPNVPVHINSSLVEKFAEQFPNHSLIQVMSEFSFTISVRQKLSTSVITSCGQEQETEVQIIVWLLQHRLLVQIHTYIYYMPTVGGLSLQVNFCCIFFRFNKWGYFSGWSPCSTGTFKSFKFNVKLFKAIKKHLITYYMSLSHKILMCRKTLSDYPFKKKKNWKFYCFVYIPNKLHNSACPFFFLLFQL
ncbi:hypothetical protein AAG570_010896 [Ranatra chinensis]|uniref:GATOR complex protein NPRL3 n=1 Tax=Ranatra chinensis TaxID=642074 RepID=A0ABD0Z199_9HEMI